MNSTIDGITHAQKRHGWCLDLAHNYLWYFDCNIQAGHLSCGATIHILAQPLKSAMSRTRIWLFRTQIRYFRTRIFDFWALKSAIFRTEIYGSFWGPVCIMFARMSIDVVLVSRKRLRHWIRYKQALRVGVLVLRRLCGISLFGWCRKIKIHHFQAVNLTLFLADVFTLVTKLTSNNGCRKFSCCLAIPEIVIMPCWSSTTTRCCQSPGHIRTAAATTASHLS